MIRRFRVPNTMLCGSDADARKTVAALRKMGHVAFRRNDIPGGRWIETDASMAAVHRVWGKIKG